ncbi:hypothetical protein KKC06_03090 [Patescibacteria group bacterium]|nr:hypothetical protein [Patescibacteria group bacterium]
MAKIIDHGETLAAWDFPEFTKYKKSALWYLVMIITVTGLVLFGIFTQSYLFIILIFILIVIYVMRSRREPSLLSINITEDGISIGQNTFYKWKDIRSFWIIYEPPEIKNLYFDFKTGLRPSISISLENQNPLRIRKMLSEYLPEDTDKENESFSDGLGRILKLQ